MNKSTELGAWLLVLDNTLERVGWKQRVEHIKQEYEKNNDFSHNMFMDPITTTYGLNNQMIGAFIKENASGDPEECLNICNNVDMHVKSKNTIHDVSYHVDGAEIRKDVNEIMIGTDKFMGVKDAIAYVDMHSSGNEDVRNVLKVIHQWINLCDNISGADAAVVDALSDRLMGQPIDELPECDYSGEETGFDFLEHDSNSIFGKSQFGKNSHALTVGKTGSGKSYEAFVDKMIKGIYKNQMTNVNDIFK